MNKDKKIFNIEDYKLKKLDNKNYWNLIEEFECLKIKIMMDKVFTPGEAYRFVILLKYFSTKGHSESFQMFCKSMLRKMSKGEQL